MTLSLASTLEDVKGIESVLTLAGTNKAKVQQLIDLIEPYASATQKGHLDMIAPPARIQLLVELEALYNSVVNV